MVLYNINDKAVATAEPAIPHTGINSRLATVDTTISRRKVAVVTLECFDRTSISPLTPVARSNSFPNPTMAMTNLAPW